MKKMMRNIVLMLAVFLLLSACNQTEEEEPIERDTAETEEQTEETPAEEDTGEVEEGVDNEVVTLAEDFIGELSAGEYEKAMEKFDETMTEQLGEEELEELWLTLEEQLGEFIDYEYDQTEAVEGYQVVLITGVFNNTDATFQVTVNENLEIAGFYIQ